MNNDTFEDNNSVPKWKVALIPLLGVVLVIVLLPKADANPSATTTTTSLNIAQTDTTKNEEQSDLAELPEGSLSSASEFNPFKMGKPLLDLTIGMPKEAGPTPEEIAAKLQNEREIEQRKQKKIALMESIKNLNVTLVIQTESGVAAIINSKTVRIGDEIQPGVVVTHIDNDGLRVRMLDEFPEENKISEDSTFSRDEKAISPE